MSKHSVLLVGAFVLPVLCCLIGVGAFVLLISPSEVSEGPDPNEVEALQEQVRSLQALLLELTDRVEQMRARCREEQKRLTLVQKVEELVKKLESDAARLMKGLSGIGEDIARIDASIQNSEPVNDKDGKQRKTPQMAQSLEAPVPRFRSGYSPRAAAPITSPEKRG